jgi:sec-independent protein translocase protein TatB
MFDIGFSEVLLIAIVALIAIGPKDIPQILFRFGRLMRQIRIFTNGFRNQYSEVMHDIELDHYRKEFEKSLPKLDVVAQDNSHDKP